MAYHRFEAFAGLGWPVVRREQLAWSWVTEAIAQHLQALGDGRITRLALELPFRTGKSTFGSVLFPAWSLLRRPSTQVLSVAADDRLALRDARACRDLLWSEQFRLAQRAASHRGVPLWSLREDSASVGDYLTSAGGERRSQSCGSAVTGSGGDLIIGDDPIDASHAYTGSTRLRDRVAWWRETLSTRGNLGARWLLIAHRTHTDDVNGYLRAAEHDRWCWLRVPVEYEGDDTPNALGWRDPRTQPGELIPRITAEDVASLKRSMGWRWAAQAQQKPVSSKGEIIDRDWLQYWTRDTLPKAFDQVLVSIDTAQKDTRESAWNVISAWGFVGPAAYLLALRRGRWKLPQIVSEARGLIALLGRVDAVLVELQSNGAAVVSELGRHVAGVIGITIDGGSPGKVARLRSTTPRWQAGNVWLPEGGERSPFDEAPHDWVAGYVEELLAFPGGDWSDQVDSTSMALQYRSEHDGGFFAAAC